MKKCKRNSWLESEMTIASWREAMHRALYRLRGYDERLEQIQTNEEITQKMNRDKDKTL